MMAQRLADGSRAQRARAPAAIAACWATQRAVNLAAPTQQLPGRGGPCQQPHLVVGRSRISRPVTGRPQNDCTLRTWGYGRPEGHADKSPQVQGWSITPEVARRVHRRVPPAHRSDRTNRRKRQSPAVTIWSRVPAVPPSRRARACCPRSVQTRAPWADVVHAPSREARVRLPTQCARREPRGQVKIPAAVRVLRAAASPPARPPIPCATAASGSGNQRGSRRAWAAAAARGCGSSAAPPERAWTTAAAAQRGRGSSAAPAGESADSSSGSAARTWQQRRAAEQEGQERRRATVATNNHQHGSRPERG